MITKFNTLLVQDAFTELSELVSDDEKRTIIFNNISDCITANALETVYKDYTLTYGECFTINDVLKDPLKYDTFNSVIINFNRQSKKFLSTINTMTREYERFNEELTRLYENIIDVLELLFYKKCAAASTTDVSLCRR